MSSPPALGIGIGLGAVGTASTVVALSFVARGGGGFDGGYFNYRAVGYAMLIPSAVLVGAATALIVVGARPTMKAPTEARGGGTLRLSISLG